jgi:CheY-like chemotaxis protein
MPLPNNKPILRVLIVDDNRDGADTLGLLVEALGHQVHVTYGGSGAVEVATAFRPHLMLIDLVMPEVDGWDLVARLRRVPAFAHTKIVAITGQKGQEQKPSPTEAGFDAVFFKPVALKDIKALLGGIEVGDGARWPAGRAVVAGQGVEGRLPIGDARRIRSGRLSKTLTQQECEAAICDGIVRFQEEYLGWRSQSIQADLIKHLVVVRIQGVLTMAERQLVKSLVPEKGRDLIKMVRRQLLDLAGPMLESMVHEVTGVKVRCMHHDISTVTGEEVVVFSLTQPPRVG